MTLMLAYNRTVARLHRYRVQTSTSFIAGASVSLAETPGPYDQPHYDRQKRVS